MMRYEAISSEELGSGIEFSYHSEQLNMATVQLAEGSDAVCTFVNDFAGADVVERLHEEGTKSLLKTRHDFNEIQYILYINIY